MLLGLFLTVLVVYVALVGLLFLVQRQLLYPGAWAGGPDATPGDPPPGFEAVRLLAEDGERLAAWWRAPAPGRAVLLYFHGNGGTLRHRSERIAALTADGRGLLILSYRGYAGSTGSPTEEGLARDARAALAFVTAQSPEAPVVIYGESLGTGVAVRLSAERRVAGVVLETPFSSAVDVARAVYWFVPVGLLMRDRFDSVSRIGGIGAPVLILHGDRDTVVPIAFGERLFNAAAEPKRFVRLPGGRHSEVLERGGLAPVLAFLAELAARP
ncbi:MAG: alpha/beta hydrolase [Acetobacteraceae bacterium]|nr:alpha/beta hydrolase [Acetobacteraceae bacterium]